MGCECDVSRLPNLTHRSIFLFSSSSSSKYKQWNYWCSVPRVGFRLWITTRRDFVFPESQEEINKQRRLFGIFYRWKMTDVRRGRLHNSCPCPLSSPLIIIVSVINNARSLSNFIVFINSLCSVSPSVAHYYCGSLFHVFAPFFMSVIILRLLSPTWG